MGPAPAGAAPQRPPKVVLGRSRRLGCFVCTQDASHSIVVAVLVLIPTGVFTTTVVPLVEWYSIVIPWVLAALALLILVCAVGIDPGIIPPASVTGRAYDPSEIVTILYDGQQVQVRVCATCLVPKPPRSSHCGFCDYCVEEYDHHCGVLGSCVAKRTFRFFAYFFDVTTLLAAYIFARSVYAATKDYDWDSAGDSNFTRWKSIAIIGCIVYTALGGCCVVGQAAMYTKLACDGKTQKDLYGRHAVPLEHNPMTNLGDSSCRNYVDRKCSRLPTSRVAEYA
jgi:hypothetical protein